jgi:UDP-N-acetylmuramyl tripeptide synthase
MNARLTFALAAGRATRFLTRRIGRGGTVFPGHVVRWIEPSVLEHLTAALPRGAVLVSGTNGKTTTTRMLASMTAASGLRPIHNRAGANLISGVVTATAEHADLFGNPTGDLGIFEVDEANVPAIAAATHPQVLALTNLFRDQLDRYGEVEAVAQTWRDAVASLAPEATLVLNADDPIVAQLGQDARARVAYFGVDDPTVGRPMVSHEADKRLCTLCGHRILYERAHYGHMGHYHCPGCGWARPTPDVAMIGVKHHMDGGSEYTIRTGDALLSLSLRLAGLYNAYNALAATTIAWTLGFPSPAIAAGLSGSVAAFGRGEEIRIGSGAIVLALVKNPVGFNETLRSHLPGRWARSSEEPRSTITAAIVAINDLFADGTDISWLWDVDFELFAGIAEQTIASGLRAEDVALRMKYALVDMASTQVVPSIEAAMDQAIQTASRGGRVLAFCSYTAMLAARGQLQRRGHVTPFWED